MKSKLIETKADREYMESIERNLNKKMTQTPKSNPFADSYRAKNAKVHADGAKKMALNSRKVGQGKSHISGKTYSS